MATGIVKLHSKGCPAKNGGRCTCKAGYEAWVYDAREARKIRKTFPRRAEAKSWRTEAIGAMQKGSAVLRSAKRDTRSLSAALAEFVEGMKAGEIRPKGKGRYKPNTVRSYERAVRVHIAKSAVGGVKVVEVERRDLQALADALLQDLSPASVSNTLNPIQAFYRWKIDRNELAFNPAEGIDLPTDDSKRPKRIASAAEAAKLLAALEAEDRALWATAFYAGLRRGELQALRCCDVDLGASLIRVERGWDQEEGVIDPKSASGRRTVPLLAVLRDYLDEHLLRSPERGGGDLVFGRSTADAFVASTVDNRAKRAWKAFNAEEVEAAEEAGRKPEQLRPITLHECRHTFASLLIDAGENPKAIQEVMGHSKIQTTFDIYGHLLPGSHGEMRTRMDAYLAPDAAATAA